MLLFIVPPDMVRELPVCINIPPPLLTALLEYISPPFKVKATALLAYTPPPP